MLVNGGFHCSKLSFFNYKFHTIVVHPTFNLFFTHINRLIIDRNIYINIDIGGVWWNINYITFLGILKLFLRYHAVATARLSIASNPSYVSNNSNMSHNFPTNRLTNKPTNGLCDSYSLLGKLKKKCSFILTFEVQWEFKQREKWYKAPQIAVVTTKRPISIWNCWENRKLS